MTPNTLKEKDKAPDFEFTHDGKKQRVSTTTKIVILYFYPRDNTPGCTIQARGFNSVIDKLADKDAIVLGVSADNEESHQGFIKTFNLKFTLIADTDKNIIEDYGCWVEKSMFGKKYMGIQRSTFVIKNGIIEKIYAKAKALSNAKDILAFLN